MDDAFAAPTGGWTPVSPRLRIHRMIGVLIVTAAAGIPAVVVLAIGLGGAGTAIGLATVVTTLLLAWVFVHLNWRSWGYAERADDLLVLHGRFFRRLVVVPYGRMQLVDVTADPVARMLGLASLRLHTAAATTDAKILGLPTDLASTLRDRLAEKGEARSAGM